MRISRLHRAFIIPALVFALLPIACTKNSNPDSSNRSLMESCPKPEGNLVLKESQTGRVIKIADGDTFTACLNIPNPVRIRVRVLGIDCPESSENAKCKRDAKRDKISCKDQIPLGKKATQMATTTLLNHEVRLESPHGNGLFEQDQFGRWLAYVRLSDGEDFGKSMVTQGLCENYQWKYPHPRGAQYGPEKRGKSRSTKSL